jgi:CDP-4-dehydro-6-deoxyglucose reductase, E1
MNENLKKHIKLQVPSYGQEEIDSVNELLNSTNLVMGKKTIEFEKEWSSWLNVVDSTMVNSGSSANLLMIQLLISKRGQYKLSLGDEILVPAVTWSTTLFPIIQLGLKPVLVDVNSETFNISVDSCKKALSSRTRGIFLVHLLGNPANMDEIMSFCHDHNLLLLEDCCESHGAKWSNNKVGTFGLASSFSYMFAHHMSTIEGGMVSTNNPLNHSIIKASRAHGWIREINDDEKDKIMAENKFYDKSFLFWDIGFNVRPTEINAAFGLCQLAKLDNFIKIRNKNFEYYIKYTGELKNKIQVQMVESEEKSFRSSFAFGLFIRDYDRYSKTELIKYLIENGIESRSLVAGNLARHPFYSLYCESPRVDLINSDKIHYGGIYLPNHQGLTKSDIKYVSKHLVSFFK